MRKTLIVVAILLGALAASGAWADEGTSPKDALLAQDAAARAGDVAADLAFYQAGGERQAQLARAIAEGDVALAALQAAVGRRFGREMAAAVGHAAGSQDADDIKNAAEKVADARATVEFKGDAPPLRLVRVEGKWKISLPDMLGEATLPQIEKLTRAVREFTAEVGRLKGLVEGDKFRSGEGVRDRVAALHDRLFKPAPPDGGGRGV